jgi:hypothetical protein
LFGDVLKNGKEISYNEAVHTQTASYYEQYKNTAITFSSFAIKKTGIIQSQTLLTVDLYSLICAPYQLSMTKILLLAYPSKDEINFFQKYRNSLAAVSMVFQLPNVREPFKLFTRCTIEQVGQMRGRENVALISADLKHCPQDLQKIIGDYFMYLDKLKVEYQDFSDKNVQITPDTAKMMGYNNYAILAAAGEQHKLALFSVAVNRAELLLPAVTKDIPPGAECSLKLYFQKYQFAVPCKISGSRRLPTGVLKAAVLLDFSPELVELIENFNFQSRMQKKAGPNLV